MSKFSQTSEFNLEGRFLGFAAEEGYKLKLLRLSTLSGECRIKLPKELRPFLYRTLTPGDWVQVYGYQKVNPVKGTVKLKADRVVPIAAQVSQPASVTPVPLQPLSTAPCPARTKQATIRICQKSDCCKRGARAVTAALQTELEERGLTEQVAICGTGCMKQCKAGPNLVMPDKSRYTRIQPGEVPALVDKHFPRTREIAAS